MLMLKLVKRHVAGRVWGSRVCGGEAALVIESGEEVEEERGRGVGLVITA